MKHLSVMFAFAAVACIVGYASYSQGTAPGADIRNPKTDLLLPLKKPIQSRLCQFDAPDVSGCEKGAE